MADTQVPHAERIPCTGTLEQLLKVFEEKQVTVVAVSNVPNDNRWPNTCVSYPGMRKIHCTYHFAWHKLETPKQACQFMFETNGRIYRKRKLEAEGICTNGPFGFEQLMEGTCKYLEDSGFVLNVERHGPFFQTK